jgi:hypothetical protein
MGMTTRTGPWIDPNSVDYLRAHITLPDEVRLSLLGLRDVARRVKINPVVRRVAQRSVTIEGLCFDLPMVANALVGRLGSRGQSIVKDLLFEVGPVPGEEYSVAVTHRQVEW